MEYGKYPTRCYHILNFHSEVYYITDLYLGI